MQKAITNHLVESATGGKSLKSVAVDEFPAVSDFGMAISTLINADIDSSSTKCHGFLDQRCEFVATDNLNDLQILNEGEELKKFLKARRSTELSSKNSGPQVIPTSAQLKSPVTKSLAEKIKAKQHVAFIVAVESNGGTIRVMSFDSEEEAKIWYCDYNLDNSVNTDDPDNVVSKNSEVAVKKYLTIYSLSIHLKSLRKYRVLFLDHNLGGEQGEVIVSYVIETILELKPLVSCFKEFDSFGDSLTADRIEDDNRFSAASPPLLSTLRNFRSNHPCLCPRTPPGDLPALCTPRGTAPLLSLSPAEGSQGERSARSLLCSMHALDSTRSGVHI